MLYHTVHSQLIRIGKTDLAHSTLKGRIRCFIIPISVNQDSFLSPKNRLLNPQIQYNPDAYKPQNFSTSALARTYEAERKRHRDVSPTGMALIYIRRRTRG